MAKLYYGNGEATIETSVDIRGVEIHYSGSMSIIGDRAGVLRLHQNNKIMVVSLGGQPLKHLFYYAGEFKIISVLVADNNAEKVPTTVHKVMDYSELITSNAEDMTEIKVEDMNVGYTYLGKGVLVKREVESPQILFNLHTSRQDGSLYLEDGSEYTGDFHVHTEDGGAMTGKKHYSDSQLLYTKLTVAGNVSDTLVPTKDVNSTLKDHRKSRRMNRAKKKIQKILPIGNKGGNKGGNNGGEGGY